LFNSGLVRYYKSSLFSRIRHRSVFVKKSFLFLTVLVFWASAFEAGAAGATGKLQVDITDVLGNQLPSRVVLKDGHTSALTLEIPKGEHKAEVPAGEYKAYVYVYVLGVPVLVDVKNAKVRPGATEFVLVNLLEGSGQRPLFAFDRDCDFALDKVEIAEGTDPADAASIPGKVTLPVDDRVFSKKARWYRGELHCHSSYGMGKESTAGLVKRAEKLDLDFLAITDRNTMAACQDPGYKSDSVALIPAMEWGSDERGVALLYGPRTFPEFVDSMAQAQALVDLIQAQGGFFAAGNPCFPGKPWQWGLSYLNGIEVWCRDWSSVPPMSFDELSEDLGERKEGKLVHSIAFAAASAVIRGQPNQLSANGQACVFYDAELVRGLKAAAIGGSGSASPDVPLASPVTYVYAMEKSVRGILDGMRRGRTYISSGLDGPRMRFAADILSDDKMDVGLGGIIPIGVPTTFEVAVDDAKGKEIQILYNGRPLISKEIESNGFVLRFEDTPIAYAVYRARVIGKPEHVRFGNVEVYAMTSPIYADDVNVDDPKIKQIKEQTKQKLMEPGPEIQLPSTPGPGEIKPKWKF